MKKILRATTMIAAFAGAASADVVTSGSARMGIANNGTDTFFTSRVRISFAGSGTTDGGLTFGAAMRADQNGGNGTTTLDLINVGPDGIAGTPDDFPETVVTAGDTGRTNGSSTVFISGAFGTLTMGDVAGGAADNLVGQVSGVGFTGLGDNNEIGFLGGSATAARYDYTMGALSVSVGIGQPTAANKAKSVAVKYAAGNYSVALGYSDTATDNQVDLKGTATFGAANVAVRVANRDSAADMAYAVSLGY